MRAAVCNHYGPPEVVHVEDVAMPQPKADEVLVRVRAAALNRTDTAFRAGKPMVTRAVSGLAKPRWRVLGTEFSGDVAAAGGSVTEFRAGDAVFGINPWRFGTHAEYLCVPAAGPYGVMALPPRYRKVDVLFLKQLIEAGRYRSVIDRVYALDDIVEAHRYVDTGQKLGNVVISVAAHAVS